MSLPGNGEKDISYFLLFHVTKSIEKITIDVLTMQTFVKIV